VAHEIGGKAPWLANVARFGACEGPLSRGAALANVRFGAENCYRIPLHNVASHAAHD
jgi:hypothetical protein